MPEYQFDLGDHKFDVPCNSPQAEVWLNRGAVWMYGFNYEEAVKCFEHASLEESKCVMAYWGIAYAVGPNYNKGWEIFPFREKKSCLATAHEAIAKGKAALESNEFERLMMDAIEARYPDDVEVEDYSPHIEAFAVKMKVVHEKFPTNLDVKTIYVEALMERTPWALWDLDSGEPAEGTSTLEAKEILEEVFGNRPDSWSHPGLLHLYIHLMEMSDTPELALPHGDKLASLVPDSGHLLHMPTHIDVLCGDYQNVVSRNQNAFLADQPFEKLRGANNFYTTYRIHNVHFIAYGAMFLAQKTVALDAAAELKRLLPETVVEYLPDLFEAFWGVNIHVMVRFGMWDEILAEPFQQNRELYSFTTALQRYGRVIAYANTGQHDLAQGEFQAFLDAKAQVQESRVVIHNLAIDVLEIAEQMAAGEQHYKSGDHETGLGHLREAVNLSDGLKYDEPWGWMQPPRHALAALLMEQEQYEEAEANYRADLGLDSTLRRSSQHPGNVWALHGLRECLVKRREKSELMHIEHQLNFAVARAEVPITASCYCRKSS